MRDNCGWPDDHKVFAKATPPATGRASLPFPPLKEYLDLGSVGLLRLGTQGPRARGSENWLLSTC